MRKTFSYREAAEILGGPKSPVVAALDTLLGGALLVASPLVPGVLALFDAKAEFVRLSHELIASASSARGGRRRQDRTRRLEAAHAVLVVTAFLETLSELDLPIRWRDLAITRREQEVLAAPLLRPMEAMPSALDHHTRNLEGIHAQQALLTSAFHEFVRGLAVWEALGEHERSAADDLFVTLPTSATRRYQELLRRLMTDFPEVAYWVNAADHESTRARVGELGVALRGLERTLATITSGAVPDDRRAALARGYQALLSRPVLDSDEVAVGFHIPTLADAYVDPRFRACEARPGQAPSEESWWDGMPVRTDPHDFLVGHLTSPHATAAPLLVLGQPGSGKSKLTQVLAARLPAADFLPVRVLLRDVPAEADVQQQIEHAIRVDTGEYLTWPQLVRSAGDALPVVLLDGFDELLQATGVSQTDYLVRVRDFQRREAEQGRSVVVLVTSRTAVVDRARIPDGTVVLRLEPFDEGQVGRWLEAWSTANAAHFAERGLEPLTVGTALAYPELAGQPLLLTMLAIYDADANAVQHAGGTLHRDDLYERLLGRFAARQITKLHPELVGTQLTQAVEQELRRLSVAALAMFNRGALWVTAADLDRDLAILFPHAAGATVPSLRAPLTPAEVTIGRFFFVHRASARRGEVEVETYEFLHATFGEFLIARFVWQIVDTMVRMDRAAGLSPLGSAALDDSLLHGVLSFTPLTVRKPIVEFLTSRASACPTEERADASALMVRLFRGVHARRPERQFADYEPTAVGVPRRHAAYSANLVLLAVITAGELRASALFEDPATTIQRWHGEALLWRSQFDNFGEWTGFVYALAVDRRWDDDHRDLLLSIDSDDSFVVPPIDLRWTFEGNRDADHPYGGEATGQTLSTLLRKVYLIAGLNEDVTGHALEPLARYQDDSTSLWYSVAGATPVSPAHSLLALVLDLPDLTKPEHRVSRYVGALELHDWPFDQFAQSGRVVLDLMARDMSVPWSDALRLLNRAVVLDEKAMLQYVLLALNRVPALTTVDHIDEYVGPLLRRNAATEHFVALRFEIWTRLMELGLLEESAAVHVWGVTSLPSDLTAEYLTRLSPELLARATVYSRDPRLVGGG